MGTPPSDNDLPDKENGSAVAEPVFALSKAVLADIREAHRELEEKDTPFRRRGYVRAIFACIDGSVAAMRQLAVLRPEKFGPDELALLRETVPSIGQNGKIHQRRIKVSLRDSLPFSFNSYMKIHGSQRTLPGDEEWDNFLMGVQIRDRVTHPKSAADFEISDADMERLKRITKWLSEQILGGMIEKNAVGFLVIGGLLLLASAWGANKIGPRGDAAE